jgi:Phosphotransferase enzyme family
MDKAAAPGTAFEAGLYELLARVAPAMVLEPLAVDRERAWILLPDGGPTIGDRLEGAERIEALIPAMVEYGRLQRRLEAHVDEALELGVADMRAARMPGRFREAVDAVASVSEARGDAEGLALSERIARLESSVAEWCDRLAESPLPASLDHNDLHPWNVLRGTGGEVRFYDWGDCVVAHPFAAMLVPLGFVSRGLDAQLDEPPFVRACDAYLEVFADRGDHAELAETLALACRVAKIARVLTWERALRAAREQGEEIDPDWADATREGLAAVAEDSWLSPV